METNEILANAGNISLNQAAPSDHSKLCEIWPKVKEGLQLLSAVIKNPVVKAVISTVIAAGDAVTKQLCG
ncbi:MAG TPA: hypothetical protein VHA56_18125 [Mucilaginibacter sp.]|nr:hypothetical protein [Mucilaginibacter sp.]